MKPIKSNNIAKVFQMNHTQNVRLPAGTRFDDDIKSVVVRVKGNERILTPVNQLWDSFFINPELPTDDFMTKRDIGEQADREVF